MSSERSAVRRAIGEGIGCVDALRRDLRQFPLLRGKKIGPVWIRTMENPGRARIAPTGAMSVDADIHVRRLTRNLSLSDDGQAVAVIDADDDERDAETRRVWRDAAIRADIQGSSGVGSGAGAIDPALWFFGRHGRCASGARAKAAGCTTLGELRYCVCRSPGYRCAQARGDRPAERLDPSTPDRRQGPADGSTAGGEDPHVRAGRTATVIRARSDFPLPPVHRSWPLSLYIVRGSLGPRGL